MDSGLYSTYTGLRANADLLEVIANNLANASTTAYKSDESFLRVFNRAVSESTQEPLDRAINDCAVVQGSVVNFSNGVIIPTGRDLDVALEGLGFFVVETPAGTRYTSNGNFHINGKGQLTTADGFFVMGTSKQDAGTSPKETSKPEVITLPKGTVAISPQGEIQVNGTRVGTLKVVDFADRRQLEKMGSALYENKSTTEGEQPAKGVQLRQGYIEQSNVNTVKQMTMMLNVLRQFESLQKCMNLIMNTMNEQSINQVGRVA
jgi:flagellar basal-body rod protein FlgF